MDEQILNNLSMRIIYYKKKFKLTNDIIAERSGLPVTTISRITSGQTKSPKLENVRKIAEAIGCTLNDLISETYYSNEETSELAQEIHDNPDLRILLDASKNLKPEDLKAVIYIANRIKGNYRE